MMVILAILLAVMATLQSSQGFKFNANSIVRKTALNLAADPNNEYANRPGFWDEPDLAPLFDANKAWVNRMNQREPQFFNNMKGHSPKVLWIGCSDARVDPNEIIGELPGTVFVHRNIANLVVNTDFNFMSVLQYAVEALGVKHVVVCGHYDCGGVKASLTNVDHQAPLENWLRNIRDTYRLHKDELNAIPELADRQRRLVELNVIEQCLNLFKTGAVQKTRLASKAAGGGATAGFRSSRSAAPAFATPRVHGVVYDPHTGVLNKLDVGFSEYMNDMRDLTYIYDLYKP